MMSKHKDGMQDRDELEKKYAELEQKLKQLLERELQKIGEVMKGCELRVARVLANLQPLAKYSGEGGWEKYAEELAQMHGLFTCKRHTNRWINAYKAWKQHFEDEKDLEQFAATHGMSLLAELAEAGLVDEVGDVDKKTGFAHWKKRLDQLKDDLAKVEQLKMDKKIKGQKSLERKKKLHNAFNLEKQKALQDARRAQKSQRQCRGAIE